MVAVSSFEAGGSRMGIAVEGLSGFDGITELPDKVKAAARMAVNRMAGRGRTMGAQAIRLQVNFPTGYLDPGQGRFNVSQYANSSDLSARIRGRGAPTSLARFISGGAPRPFNKGGVTVAVKPGHAAYMPRAFVFPLKNGNVGLAVRTSGAKPARAYLPKSIGNGLWLLYGPSVDQVWNTVRSEVAPDIAQGLEDEFNRLMALDL